MYTNQSKQFPYTGGSTREGSIANMCVNTPVYGITLRKELAMASIRQRRGSWYARVLWYDETGRKKEKQVPLKTKSKVTARERLVAVNKEESDIKDGLVFSFPWLNGDGVTKVIRFTVVLAVEEWRKRREKNGIRPTTLEINKTGLNHCMDYIGKSRPVEYIATEDIDG